MPQKGAAVRCRKSLTGFPNNAITENYRKIIAAHAKLLP